jgi:hypothetical protein
MTASLSRRVLALSLCATVILLIVPAPVRAEARAEFAGRVFDSDGITPRSGVVIALYDAASEQTFRSQPTSDEGNFRIADAPAGTYALLAETGEVAYLANDELELQEGANRPLALTLQTAPGNQTTTQQQSGMSPVVKWVIVGVIAATALYLIYDVTKESDASPS